MPQLILTSIALKNIPSSSFPQQFLHDGCAMQSFPRPAQTQASSPGLAQAPSQGWAQRGPCRSHTGVSDARAHRLLQQCITADKVNPVINMECRSRLRGVIHNSYCTSPIHCTRRDCLEVDSGSIRR